MTHATSILAYLDREDIELRAEARTTNGLPWILATLKGVSGSFGWTSSGNCWRRWGR